MFERFTDRARRVVVLAQEEARALDHHYIGVEHILVGVIRVDGGGADILRSLGVALERVLQDVREIIGRGPDTPTGHIPFTPRAKRTLELSLREALQLGHTYIGTEHLLLGLISEGEGVAAQVLLRHGVDQARARRQTTLPRVETLRAFFFEKVAPERGPEPPPAGAAPPARAPQPSPAPPEFFSRFTDRARRVVVLGQEEARMLNHNYIGTEHILLGLIHEGEGVAARALGVLGINLEGVRGAVEGVIGRGESAPVGHIPFTPRSKKVLELSQRESLQLGHEHIGTEHILLGLIREGEGVAAQVLVRQGADLNRVRQQVLILLSVSPRPLP